MTRTGDQLLWRGAFINSVYQFGGPLSDAIAPGSTII